MILGSKLDFDRGLNPCFTVKFPQRALIGIAGTSDRMESHPLYLFLNWKADDTNFAKRDDEFLANSLDEAEPTEHNLHIQAAHY